MKINIKIPKRIVVIKANNYNDALYNFNYEYLLMSKYSYVFSSKYGNHYMSFDNKKHIVYNVQIYKRKKHKSNKRYEFTIYYIKDSLFDFVKIDQHRQHFKIISK